MSGCGKTDTTIPVICLAPGAVGSYRIFNPNEWDGQSRAIVQTCAAVLGAASAAAQHIRDACARPVDRCERHLNTLAGSVDDPSVLGKASMFGQDIELHNAVFAFVGNVKALLDLLVQLLSSEGVCNAQIHGFHDSGSRVLNALCRNVAAEREPTAKRLAELVNCEKTSWIDEFISVRDDLIHPQRGSHVLMFGLEVIWAGGRPSLKDAHAPAVGDSSLDCFVDNALVRAREFAARFLRELKTAPAS
jgi:hypothetical protein